MNDYEWRDLPFRDFGDWFVLSRVFDGDDNVGFSALLGGGYYRGEYEALDKIGEFWVPAERTDISPLFAMTTSLSKFKVSFGDNEQKPSKLPVRCVKDYVVEK